MKIRFLNDIREFLLRIRLKYFSEKIYYINSPQMLPPPLKKAEEQELTERIANGDEKAREPLIVHNLRLVVYIAKKFESSGVNIEDLVSIGTIGLIKSVNTFCPDKNIKLATYASRCIENEILMYLRRANRIKGEVSLDEPLNVDWDGNELLLSDVLGTEQDVIYTHIEEEVNRGLLSYAMNQLSGRERQLMEMRYGLISGREMTQKEVADELGISQSYISRLEKKIINRLRREIKKLG
jgi:RNA polymerase sporulation-specific sigma factor